MKKPEKALGSLRVPVNLPPTQSSGASYDLNHVLSPKELAG